jgi:predicted metal-dependent phosphoesterase TrpH
MIESLHAHTTLSDGKLSHKEMFELAQNLNVSVVAFTDHDSIPGEETLNYLESVRNEKTKWIIGIEISADLPKDIPDQSNGGLHVIGLFVDPKNQELLDYCQKSQKARVERMEKMVTNLQNIGFTITAEDCLLASRGEAVGRPHIVEALDKYPENKNVVMHIIDEMKTDAENDPTLNIRYKNMIEAGERQYPYTLFLSGDSYKKAYEDTSGSPDLDEAVALIRNAGGIASIAHYFTINKKMPFSFVEQLLKNKRIDGMETVYGMWHLGKSDEQKIKDDQAEIERLLSLYDGIQTGGSDAHKEEDMRQYASLPDFADKSAGMARKILASGKVNPLFSSFS